MTFVRSFTNCLKNIYCKIYKKGISFIVIINTLFIFIIKIYLLKQDSKFMCFDKTDICYIDGI